MSEIKITKELLADLKSKAEKATPGPWKYNETDENVYDVFGPYALCHVVFSGRDADYYDCIYGIENEYDAEYISAANPQMVLALLDEIDRLNKLVDLWRHDYETLSDHCSRLNKEVDWLTNFIGENACVQGEPETTICPSQKPVKIAGKRKLTKPRRRI